MTIGSQQWVVNELTSPDPFTHTYQLPSGSLVVSNEPLETIVTFSGDEGPEPPRVLWTSEYADQWEVLPGRMEVYFDRAITETEIQQLITAFNLNVVMSWFEPPDDSGMNSAIGGGGGFDRGSSVASGADGPVRHPDADTAVRATGMGEEAGDGARATGKTASGGPLSFGNEIAWFDFEYDQQMLPTVEAAYQFFKGLPHLESCLPHITDYAAPTYPTPNDRIYDDYPSGADYEWESYDPGPQYFHRQCRWIDAYQFPSYPNDVPLAPYSGKQQYIAVIDSGVYRAHSDMGRLCSVGVECYDRSYEIVQNGANPVYQVTKPGMEDDHYWGRLHGHGTQIASLINGAAQNWTGIPSLAPGATILPIRLKQWTKTYGLPNVPYEATFSANTHVKAVRALRFQFFHGSYDFYVRVVSMSFAYPSYVRNLPWPPNFPTGEFKTNLSRDLKLNDRLYVGAAGNEGREARLYPAAHDGVLGVTGLNWDWDSDSFYLSASNFMADDTYPVSGVFGIFDEKSFLATTPAFPSYRPAIDRKLWNYDTFAGTSAAAPQIAAFGYHLYSKYPSLGQKTYLQVKQRIVSTKRPGIGVVKGVASYHAAISGW